MNEGSSASSGRRLCRPPDDQLRGRRGGDVDGGAGGGSAAQGAVAGNVGGGGGGHGPPSPVGGRRAGAAPSGRPLASEPPSAFAGRPPSQVRGRAAAGGAAARGATAELARLGGDMTLELGPTVNTTTAHAAARPTPKSPGHGRRAPLNGARARGAGGCGAAPLAARRRAVPTRGFAAGRRRPCRRGVGRRRAAAVAAAAEGVAAAARPAGASPRMHRAKVWTPAVEDAWRAQPRGTETSTRRRW